MCTYVNYMIAFVYGFLSQALYLPSLYIGSIYVYITRAFTTPFIYV